MKVWRRVFSPKHLNDDAEKLADGWHGLQALKREYPVITPRIMASIS